MTIRLVLGGLPLLIYPFVAIASLMGLAGHVSENEPVVRLAAARAFYIGTLSYPLVFLGCLTAALTLRKQKKEPRAAKFATAPLYLLAALCALLAVLVALE